MHILNKAWDLPDTLLNEEGYDEMAYASDILDFEYGTFDKSDEKYPNWVTKYFNWKKDRKI